MNWIPFIPEEDESRISYTVGTAVAVRRDKRQAVHEFQFTRCWSVADRQGDSAWMPRQICVQVSRMTIRNNTNIVAE